MKATFRISVLALLALTSLFVHGQSSTRWIFEGVITETDPSLAPDLQSGWVLAGSFLLAPVEMTEEPVDAKSGGGRLGGGITETELSVDLYYQLHFEAVQVPGLVGFDYQDNDPEADGRDMLGWFFPVRGQLKESGWSSRWLQVWLVDPDGKMIRSTPPQVSPYGLDFQSAWFRLTFENEAGESVHADGRLEVFSPEGQLEEVDEETRWRGVAAELSEQLMQRDSVIVDLRAELAASQARLSGLRNMVDLLFVERNNLEIENSLLEEKAALADPELGSQIENLTADKSLLENEIEELSDKNRALADSLANSEQERSKLLSRLQELTEDEMEEEIVQAPPPTVVPVYNQGQPVGTMTIVEEPMIIERPVVVEQIVTNSPPEPPVVASPAPKKRKRTSSRHGPRKFR